MAASLRGATPLPRSADHPDLAVAAGSNRLFRELALWARHHVTSVKATGGSEAAFRTRVEAQAYRLIASMQENGRHANVDVTGMAAKVASWTWNVFRIPPALKPSLAGPELAARLADGGRKAAAKRSGRSVQAIVTAALRLAENHGTPTQAMVGVECGRSEKTVRRHWSAVRAAIKASLDYGA